MRTAFVIAAVTTPIACITFWSALPGQANNRRLIVPDLPPLPPVQTTSNIDIEQQFVYVQLRNSLSLSRLAVSLSLDPSLLARLNNLDSDAVMSKGHWCVVPSQQRSRLLMLTAVDASSIRTTAPKDLSQAVVKQASSHQVDSLSSFLQRHGIQQTELKTLTPDQADGELKLGREMRVSRSAGRSLLAIRPSVSGGVSWPSIPELTDPQSAPQPAAKYQWPTKGVFTSGYGWRWGRMHKGIDIANNTGTSIHAARDGTVTHAGWMGAYGFLVEIAHDDGESTRYAHNSRLMVQQGQRVRQGTRIALMGSTGRSTGPHLHFEIRRPGGGASNPLAVLPPRQS